jgi:hypothetical protein
MQEHLWPNVSCPLAQIPTEKLQVAMTCSSTGSPDHYQRLEQLGDTILKFTVSCQLIAEYPSWPEGFLTAAMQRIVSNVKLAERCFELSLSKYIIRSESSNSFQISYYHVLLWMDLFLESGDQRIHQTFKRWMLTKKCFLPKVCVLSRICRIVGRFLDSVE